MRGPSDWGDGTIPKEETPTHRLEFVMKILERQKGEKHGEDLTAFLRIFRYDPESGRPFFRINGDIISCPKNDLFGRFSYQPEGEPHLFICDYTDLYPYSCKPKETYDPPQGLELAAKLNVQAYKKALSQLQRLQLLASKKNLSIARTQLIEYYDRIIDDFEEWVGRVYKETPSCLKLEKLAVREKAKTEKTFNLDKSLPETKIYREQVYPKCWDNLRKTGRLSLQNLIKAIADITGIEELSVKESTLIRSFQAWANKKRPKSMRKTVRYIEYPGLFVLDQKRKIIHKNSK